jgi:hypothetical protein
MMNDRKRKWRWWYEELREEQRVRDIKTRCFDANKNETPEVHIALLLVQPQKSKKVLEAFKSKRLTISLIVVINAFNIIIIENISVNLSFMNR